LCDGLVTLPRYQDRVTRSEGEDQKKIDSLDINDEDRLDTLPVTNTIRSYATCLRPHLTYKTVMITQHTTSKQVILGLLSRFRMTHRDPKLFYLTMEVTINQTFQTITLEDNSRPAEIISCNPWGGCKFILRSKTGGLVKIYDHHIRPDSVYKSILISSDTTVSDTLNMLWSCYPQQDCQYLCLFAYYPDQDYETIIDGCQCLLDVMKAWEEGTEYKFVVKSIKRPIEPHTAINEQIRCEENQSKILQYSFRKGDFMKTKKNSFNSENETSRLFSMTVDSSIDSDT
jgi:hypothetical protein